MIADFLIYAVGGGKGHAVRGGVLQQLLRKDGHSSIVLVRPENLSLFAPDAVVRPNSENFSQNGFGLARSIIVDTFPGGWQNELSETFLKRFEQRIFLARYRRGLSWTEVSRLYDSVILPYESREDEWGELPVPAKSVGFLLRENAPAWTEDGESLLLIDPERRCGERFLNLVQKISARCSRPFRLIHDSSEELRAGKFLFIGAGYNTFYEVLRRKIDACFLPVQKRYDDQAHRARRWGVELESLPALAQWMAAPVQVSRKRPSFSGKFLSEAFFIGERKRKWP